MKYHQFLQAAEALKPEEAGDYTELRPWGGCERVQINGLKIDEANPSRSMVKITAKNIIVKELRLRDFRIDEAGGVYLHTDVYRRFDPDLRQQSFREKREEVEQELIDFKQEKSGNSGTPPPLSAEEPEPQEFDPATYDPSGFDPAKATEEEGRNLIVYNEWLVTQGRGDEQVIPF